MLQHLDLAILRAVYLGHLPSPWIDAILAVSFMGSGWMLLGLLPAFFWQKWRGPALALLAALTILSGVVAALKALTGRVRPCHAVAWTHTLTFAVPSDNSFPSGHAAGSLAFAFFVMVSNRRIGAWLLVVAAAIALTRVALGMHYPSDVVGGAMLGSSFGWAAARLYERRRPGPLAAVGRLPDADAEPVGK